MATPHDLMATPHDLPRYRFPKAPRNVYWETTSACSLKCRHCRAEAIPNRDPEELTYHEALPLLDAIAELGSMLVLTGGDPLERPDLFELVAAARSRHIPVAVTPSTTPSLTEGHVAAFRELGVTALGISLDGPNAEIHDGFRGVPGTFAHSMNALRWAEQYGLKVQINTTCTKETFGHLDALFALLQGFSAVKRFTLFFLVATGRGAELTAPDASDAERTFDWIYEHGADAPFHISTVEAPHYRRYLIERRMREGATEVALLASAGRLGFGIHDGNGVIFVNRIGEVTPAGFLPVPTLGNVRDQSLVDIYRHHPDLQALRDMERLRGRCGRCRFRYVCGGSRARAYANLGSIFAEDPGCGYQPVPGETTPWPGHPVALDDHATSHHPGHPGGAHG